MRTPTIESEHGQMRPICLNGTTQREQNHAYRKITGMAKLMIVICCKIGVMCTADPMNSICTRSPTVVLQADTFDGSSWRDACGGPRVFTKISTAPAPAVVPGATPRGHAALRFERSITAALHTEVGDIDLNNTAMTLFIMVKLDQVRSLRNHFEERIFGHYPYGAFRHLPYSTGRSRLQPDEVDQNYMSVYARKHHRHDYDLWSPTTTLVNSNEWFLYKARLSNLGGQLRFSLGKSDGAMVDVWLGTYLEWSTESRLAVGNVGTGYRGQDFTAQMTGLIAEVVLFNGVSLSDSEMDDVSGTLLAKHLSDEDECASETHNCHVNAVCEDNLGSFTCRCQDGYVGNGTSCERESMHMITMIAPSADGDLTNWPQNRRTVWQGVSPLMFADGGLRDGGSLSIFEFQGVPTFDSIVSSNLTLHKVGDLSDPTACSNMFTLRAGIGNVSDASVIGWSVLRGKKKTFTAPGEGKIELDVTALLQAASLRNAGSFSLLMFADGPRCKAAFATKEHMDPMKHPMLIVESVPASISTAARRDSFSNEGMITIVPTSQEEVVDADEVDELLQQADEMAKKEHEAAAAVPPRHYLPKA